LRSLEDFSDKKQAGNHHVGGWAYPWAPKQNEHGITFDAAERHERPTVARLDGAGTHIGQP
jgi:hypothetical protein